MQARKKRQQKAMAPLAEASKLLEPHTASSVHRWGAAPDTMSQLMFWLWVVVLPSDESPNM